MKGVEEEEDTNENHPMLVFYTLRHDLKLSMKTFHDEKHETNFIKCVSIH